MIHMRQNVKHLSRYYFIPLANVKVAAVACVNIDTYNRGMTDYRDWYKSATGRRITADEIGTALNLSRPSVTRRLISPEGLSADEIITVSRAHHVNPVEALVDLGHLTTEEAMNYLDIEGQLVETSDEGYLALELARRLNPATKAPEIDELAARRSNTEPGDVRPMPYAANRRQPEPEEGDDDFGPGA